MALMSYHSVSRFTSEHVVVGTDLGTLSTDGGMSGVPAGTTVGRSAHMDVNADHEHACFAYSTANGLLANLSINGAWGGGAAGCVLYATRADAGWVGGWGGWCGGVVSFEWWALCGIQRCQRSQLLAMSTFSQRT